MKTNALAILILTAALLAPAGASAHISLHPNTIPAGAFATVELRVPGEQQGAHVTKVAVLFPLGFVGVDYENVSGWSTHVIESKLAHPIEEDGGTIESQVSEIVWSWSGPAGEVGNGQFIDFPLSLAIPAGDSGSSLQFKAVQTYSNGQVVHWIDPSLQAEHPSPRIDVTAKGGAIEDVAGDEAGPAPGQTPSPTSASTPAVATHASGGGASKGLGLAALVLGALGFIAGLLALARSRPRRAG